MTEIMDGSTRKGKGAVSIAAMLFIALWVGMLLLHAVTDRFDRSTITFLGIVALMAAAFLFWPKRKTRT